MGEGVYLLGVKLGEYSGKGEYKGEGRGKGGRGGREEEGGRGGNTGEDTGERTIFLSLPLLASCTSSFLKKNDY